MACSRASQTSSGVNDVSSTDTEIVIPDTIEELFRDDAVDTDRPWLVIVWDDPVNLMSYVVYVFQKLFNFSREKATRLMHQVHYEGKAVVANGTREKCETDVARLHAFGLWATLQRSG
jgi:ATP-dependent Clp protease adaptor protein ClpS